MPLQLSIAEDSKLLWDSLKCCYPYEILILPPENWVPSLVNTQRLSTLGVRVAGQITCVMLQHADEAR